MAALVPGSFPSLIVRAFDELDRNSSIFGLPSRKFVLPDPQLDTSVRMHGRRIASPLGPSAGPHTQMAQNIVLSWLAGARVVELKTVQTLDSLRIPRPCIESRDLTFNVEWSQELTLEQSLEEYVKASMLIDMLASATGIDATPLFDLSVGYDLKGIRSDRVVAFMRGMMDARSKVAALRDQIPRRFAHLRDMAFNAAIASSVTLSTFHGCPVSEIEDIAGFLMAEMGLDCTIKLNPTLLGASAVHKTLGEILGFTGLHVPPSAFANDPAWEQACEMVDRLQRRATALGRSFGIKLTNTLIVENSSNFLPQSERVVYLSGAPLHVLAMHLVRRFRHTFGVSLPISFSAGIDRTNYADAVSLGLVPVTVCTDLLKQGGYGRLPAYAAELNRRMKESGSKTVEEFIRRGRDRITRSLAEALIRNTDDYVAALDSDPRYRNRQVLHKPKRARESLTMFDCSMCDLCIAVCPNAAVFPLPAAPNELDLHERHQIAIFADWCNDCGNCEVFCPDLGAPNRLKPRLFVDPERWRRDAPEDGFLVGPGDPRVRTGGHEYTAETAPPAIRAALDYVRRAALDPAHVNAVNSLSPEER